MTDVISKAYIKIISLAYMIVGILIAASKIELMEKHLCFIAISKIIFGASFFKKSFDIIIAWTRLQLISLLDLSGIPDFSLLIIPFFFIIFFFAE